MPKYCLALDLKNDAQSIQEYIDHHKQVSPEIIKSIRDSGIESMEIFNTGNRLFMIMEVSSEFTFDKKDRMDRANEAVQEWELKMDQYQQKLPFSKRGEKWVLMDKIFDLKN